MKLENITTRLSEEQVKADKELVTQIQIKLRGLGLYPGGKSIDGDFGSKTRNAIKNFCDTVGIQPQYDRTFAQNLLTKKQLPSVLGMVNSSREQMFQNLLSIAKSTQLSAGEEAAFLHRGIQKNSKYIAEIAEYPLRMAKKYEANVPSGFTTYPKRGVIPTIDNEGLSFLHSDIKEACVCIGNFVNGEISARWLGKNALEERQFWSATKIIPILNVICNANMQAPEIDVASCYINERQCKLTDVILDIINYQNKITSSNAGAATLKLFQTPTDLEKWVKDITGNQQLSFRSGYGRNPFTRQPQLFDSLTGKKVLNPPATALEVDKNYLSAYDLTRLISMLGWHLHLKENARLPGAQWQSLKTVITAMGNDPARYIEVAIETLGLENVISSPVIISKLGNGFSDSRGTNEITYVAFVQFIDERIQTNNQGKFRTLAMALRGVVKPPLNFIELDARVAAEVTEIIRRVVTDEIK